MPVSHFLILFNMFLVVVVWRLDFFSSFRSSLRKSLNVFPCVDEVVVICLFTRHLPSTTGVVLISSGKPEKPAITVVVDEVVDGLVGVGA